MGRNVELEEKHKWSTEKPKLDNARRSRVIYFFVLEDKEFKETIKNVGKKLETLMAPAMLCKTRKKSKHGKTRGKINEIIQNACILEALHCNIFNNLVHNFVPLLQTRKIPAAKAVVKEWEKLEEILAWNLTEVRSKKEVIDEARTKGEKVHFASSMDVCHLKKCRNRGKAPKKQRWSCVPRRYCER